ncbi:DNA polymerase IV [Streptomyces griseoviridis]|uniref:DNA polymerase IV n=1 Tax=Streptomyces griseoviridis TaxID=45398 RepID=A0ABT9LDL1_STRGD|nr:DNA polymerase IV [Streptomyces griseoviridis]MDP9680586.1 DNA polymerase-4 [Streptomyces griseoviridis]GGT07998.1 DNA polymerase IV [Streptomyces griseoviridis]
MRTAPTILHLDMDAFYASVEQASKPSLRGKAVVVGGLGPRGVVATASYEARVFGVHSAMPMAQARRLAPHAAYLVPRFQLYRSVSEQVMGLLRALSPLVEPLSLDEAFVDLEAGGTAWDAESARLTGTRLRADIRTVTGLTGSVGLAASKMLAKIASEDAKPDGLVLIEPGTERDLLAPMPVRTLPGVGPATGDHLRRAGITTVGEIAEAGEDELVRLLGKAHGHALYAMALAHDERPVVAEREAKSVSVEDTYDVDIHDRTRVGLEVRRLAERCVGRLRGAGLSGRTIVLKVRRYDFSTLTRSETLRGPTDDVAVVAEAAARLLDAVDTTGGVRLLGVGVTGLADFTQEDLFAQAAEARAAAEERAVAEERAAAGERGGPGERGAAEEQAVTGAPPDTAVAEAGRTASAEPDLPPPERRWPSGHDVRHSVHGHGWVQGSGLGRVTVRFETPYSARPGRVRTFRTDDPELEPAEPLPLVERRPEDAGPVRPAGAAG